MSDVLVAAARRLAPVDRLRALGVLEARIARLQAEQLAMLAAIEADPVTVSVPGGADKNWADKNWAEKNWAVEDVAVELRLSPGVARARLAEAHEAVRVPRLLAMLAAGRMTMGHLRVVLDQTVRFDDDVVRGVEDRVLDQAGNQSVTAFRATVRRAVLVVARPSLEQQRAANVADRRVCLRRAGEGTSELWALLPEQGAAALMSALTGLAERRAGHGNGNDAGNDAGDDAGDDERTADQRRADALVQLGLDALTGQPSRILPRRQRLRAAVQVTVALSTLLGDDEQPGELSGIGPIPATLARHLAHDTTGTWRRLITDPTGRLIDYGRTTYRPPAALAEHVTARDRTCRFPHCTRSAERSDLDHTIPWAAGGRTNAPNLTTLCPRHHHLRHETDWTYTRRANGDTEWRTHTGATYTTPAATYPIDTTPPDTSDPDPPPF
jgi:hypothetical protein